MEFSPLPGGYTLPVLRSSEVLQRSASQTMLHAASAVRDTAMRHALLAEKLKAAFSLIGKATQEAGIRPQNFSPKEYAPIQEDLADKSTKRLLTVQGKQFPIVEFKPPASKHNGKTVVLLSGLGMTDEGYFRIGEETFDDSILLRLLQRGFNSVLVDFPGMGTNRNYPAAHRDSSLMAREIMPALIKHLKSKVLKNDETIYFVTHSLGAQNLNKYVIANQYYIREIEWLYQVMGRRFSMGGTESPVLDVHPLYPAAMLGTPLIFPFVSGIPYQQLGRALGKTIPYGALIGGSMSLISDRNDFPPSLLHEMFDYATENFPPELAGEMMDHFWDQSFYGSTLPVILGHRDVRVIGHNDPLSPVEGMYLHFLQADSGAGTTQLLRITGEAEGLEAAIKAAGSNRLTGIAVDNLRHFDCSCVNSGFDRLVWPLLLSFLDES